MPFNRPTIRRKPLQTTLNIALLVMALASMASLCLEYGFDKPPLPFDVLLGVQIATVVVYLAMLVVRLVQGEARTGSKRWAWRELAIMLLASVLLIGAVRVTYHSLLKLGAVYVMSLQVLLVLRFAAGVVRWNMEMSRKILKPARLLAASFLITIFVGGILLSLPKAVSPELRHESYHYASLRIINSFFTATSATCVTGLVVYDTGKDLTFFGQVVVLALIQAGGLGIMIFSSVFGLLAGMRFSLRQSLLLQDALSHETIGRMAALVRFIVIATFACEGLGALLLYPMFAQHYGETYTAVYYSVFHAISAFCNAGFALETQSLMDLRSYWGVYVSIMPLIVLGGLGFPVLQDLHAWLTDRLSIVAPWKWRSGAIWRQRPVHRRFSLHTKLVAVATISLIVVPAIALFAFESREWRSEKELQRAQADPKVVAMTDMPPSERALAALFQSVTARTAGFNTVAMDSAAMSPASHFLLAVLMFIGGSPASTAGGVKTVVVAVLVLSVLATLRGRRHVEVFGRTISEDEVRRSAAIVTVMLAMASLIVLLLSFTESASLREVLFESVSALGTVGLSTGLTARLTAAGRLIIMLAMFAGRLGPLTLMIAIAGGVQPARYEYPTERVIIG